MTKSACKFSRRQAVGLLFLAPAPLVLASSIPAFADHEREMRRALAGITLPVRPASLELVEFSRDVRNARVHMAAVVRMTWPPGMRQRRFTSAHSDPDQALADLLDDIQTRFAAAA